MIVFRDRKELVERYEAWLERHPSAADCPLNVVTFLQLNGNLKRTWTLCLEKMPSRACKPFYVDTDGVVLESGFDYSDYEYLVQTEDGRRFVAICVNALEKTCFVFNLKWVPDVVAWQELPDKYED